MFLNEKFKPQKSQFLWTTLYNTSGTHEAFYSSFPGGLYQGQLTSDIHPEASNVIQTVLQHTL